MIAFVYGTTAELIKIAPVYRRLLDAGMKPELWCTGQHIEELASVSGKMGFPPPDVVLADGRGGRNLTGLMDVPMWLLTILRTARRRRRELEERLWVDGLPPLLMVHGDTMTTVVGALIGRWLGATVGHIEAGVRTNNLFEPFPEELDRRAAAHLAQIHFTPGIENFGNIWGARGVKVDTGVNTVYDSLRLVPQNAASGLELPDEYGLVSLHRFELIRNNDRFEEILAVLSRWAAKTPLLVVTDAQTSARIDELGLHRYFDDSRLIRIGKLPYFDFVSVLRGAKFVVTDSGGLHQECVYLNIPCLVHRNATELTEGIGDNVVLSMFDVEVVDRFLADPGRHRAPHIRERPSPSDIIVAHLVHAGYVSPPGSPPPRPANVSIVVPAFHQADIIKSALENAVRSLDSAGIDYEIVVVASDRSGSGTAAEAERVRSERVRVLRYAEGASRSVAVKYAFAQTCSDVVAITEPLMLIAPDNIIEAIAAQQRSGADVVSGSKVHPGSDVLMTGGRQWQTRVFAAVIGRLFDLRVGDAQLGLKVVRSDVLREVIPYLHNGDFGFDIELLASAQHLGCRIEQSPVRIPGRMGAVRNPLWLLEALVGTVRLVALSATLRRERRSIGGRRRAAKTSRREFRRPSGPGGRR